MTPKLDPEKVEKLIAEMKKEFSLDFILNKYDQEKFARFILTRETDLERKLKVAREALESLQNCASRYYCPACNIKVDETLEEIK